MTGPVPGPGSDRKADTISLNRARKYRARAERKAQADANVLKHGRGKAEKALDTAQNARATRMLDQHRREPE